MFFHQFRKNRNQIRKFEKFIHKIRKIRFIFEKIVAFYRSFILRSLSSKFSTFRFFLRKSQINSQIFRNILIFDIIVLRKIQFCRINFSKYDRK